MKPAPKTADETPALVVTPTPGTVPGTVTIGGKRYRTGTRVIPPKTTTKPETPAPEKPANDGTIAKPAPATPAPKAASPEPMGFTMHFHMGGNFDASFEMNVTQGQAKQKASVTKKRKSDAAKKPAPYLQPAPATTMPRPESGNPAPHGAVTY